MHISSILSNRKRILSVALNIAIVSRQQEEQRRETRRKKSSSSSSLDKEKENRGREKDLGMARTTGGQHGTSTRPHLIEAVNITGQFVFFFF